jgi:hypothetical protein
MSQQPKSEKKPDKVLADPNKWSGFLYLLITHPRGWLGMTVVAAIAISAALTAITVINPEQIEILTNSGSIALRRGSTQDAIISLSPNGGNEEKPWVRTGIEVKKGDKIKITASGRVNTSIRRIVAKTQRTEIGEQIWASPTGIDSKVIEPYFSFLDQYKLLPKKDKKDIGFGTLLATVGYGDITKQPENIEPEDIEPFVPRSLNDNFMEFSAKSDGELELTVNDIWLSEDKKNAYVPPVDKNISDDGKKVFYYLQLAELEAAVRGEDFKSWSEETKRKKKEEQHQRRNKGWDSIKKNKDWNIWYNENIGAFSVSITVNEKD